MAQTRADRARRAAGTAGTWAIRLLVTVAIVLGALLGLLCGLVAVVLGADAVALLAGPLIGGGVAYLLVRTGLAYGHRLAPLALWVAERRARGSGTLALALVVVRALLGREGPPKGK